MRNIHRALKRSGGFHSEGRALDWARDCERNSHKAETKLAMQAHRSFDNETKTGIASCRVLQIRCLTFALKTLVTILYPLMTGSLDPNNPRHQQALASLTAPYNNAERRSRVVAFDVDSIKLAPHLGLMISNLNGPVILLIDDEESIRQVLSLALEFEGYRIFSASNGREAIEMLSHIPRPSLILLDLMMPVMNGWAFMEAIQKRREYADIPVAVVTAFSERAEGLKAVALLQKPVELDKLFALVRRYSDNATQLKAAG